MGIASFIPATLALCLAGAASVGAAMLAVDRIEETALSSVSRVLMVEGHDWADVKVDGLSVVLSGTAPDEATRFKALRAAGSIVDDSRVIDKMEVAAAKKIAPPRFSIEILRNDAGVSLIGLVPAAMDRGAMAEELGRLTRGAPVTDLMESAEYPVPAGWASSLDFALDVLGELPRSKISIAADRIEVTTVAESVKAKRKLETQLRREAPDSVNLVLNVSSPRPVISPFTLRFVIDPDGTSRFDACSAHSETGRSRILSAAREAGAIGKIECTLGLGVPSPQWADAVTAGIFALGKMGGGSITYSDADVSLVALETTPQGTFDAVVGELETALPDVFALNATKPEPVVVDGTGNVVDQGPKEFVATLSPEGLLALRGRITDERQRHAVSGFAMARFPGAELTPAMRMDADLPDGWAARVFAGLEALSMLANGALVVQEDFVDIRGNTGVLNARAEISRILSAQLGDGANYKINVNYIEKLDPLADLPTPQECVDQVNEVKAAQKITFEPGSAEIDGRGFATIDKIAEILTDCSEVPIEIAGYTDSQGREEMNLSLSQQRAEAVLNALRTRRVLTSNLTPRGYGEANPIADNDTEEGREANRRIEFTLIAEAEDQTAATDPSPDAETDTSNEQN